VNGFYFTDRCRRILQLAWGHANRLGHEYVSPDHILLGLISDGEGVGATALVRLGVDLAALQADLESRLVVRAPRAPQGDLPFTSSAKRVFELAMVEARDLDHKIVGSEHLLLAMLGSKAEHATEVLHESGLSRDRVREEIWRVLGGVVPLKPSEASGIERTLPADRQLHSASSPGRTARRAILLSSLALVVAIVAFVVALHRR